MNFKRNQLKVAAQRPRFQSWLSFVAGCLLLVIAANLFTNLQVQTAYGAYTASSTDADGNTHLGSNTVNDTAAYDTTTDSSPGIQQQLGIDPNWQNGVARQSYALDFYYANHTYAAASGNNMPNITSAFTIEGWVNPSSCPTDHIPGVIFGKNNSSGVGYSVTIDNTCHVGFGPLTTTAALSRYVWTLVTGIFDGTNAYIFFNGVLQTNGAMTTPTNNSASVVLGRDDATNDNNYFNGILDEVRFSSGVRYPVGTSGGTTYFAPQRRFAEDATTVGLWHLDEGSGTVAHDSSIYGDDLTLSHGSGGSNPKWVTGADAVQDGFNGAQNQNGGQTGAGNITLADRSSDTSNAGAGGDGYDVKVTGSNGLNFSGSQYVSFPAVSTLFPQPPSGGSQGTGNFTVEAWMKTSTSDGGVAEYVYSSRGFGSTVVALGMFTGNQIYAVLRDTNANTISISAVGPDLHDGAWHHIAMVRDSQTTLKAYVDGTLVGSASNATMGNSGQGELVTDGASTPAIGELVGTGNAFTGTIDEVRVSTTARYSSNFTPSQRFATDASTGGLWHLDEGSGTTPADSSGNGNNGTFGVSAAPSWTEGIGGNGTTSSTNWALPGYAFRKQIQITNSTSALPAGYAVQTTENRANDIDNKRTLPSGNDWQIVRQPSNSNSSLTYNGSASNYVDIPDSPSLDSITNKMTIDFWEYQTTLATTSTTQALVSKWFRSVGQWDVLTGNNSTGDITVCIAATASDGCNEQVYTGANALTVNQWNHIAITYDGTQSSNTTKIQIYINGISQGLSSAGGSMPSSMRNPPTITQDVPDVLIGRTDLANTDLQLPFTGQIDELRISNTVRYVGNFTPITNPYGADSNTLGLWHLDEGSGTATVDSSGNGNNGSIQGSLTWATTGAVSTNQELPRFIPHGNALSFTGSSTYAKTSSQVISSGAFTMETWFDPTSSGLSATQTLMSQGNGSNAYIQLNTSSSGKLQGIVDGSTAINGTTMITANTWHNAVLEYDPNQSSKLRLYLDGKLEATSSSVSATYTGNNVTIGGTAVTSPGQIFNGLIDEARISSVARYTSSSFTTSTSPLISDSKTLALWHLDDAVGSGTAASQGSGQSLTITGATFLANGGYVNSINQTQFKLVSPISASGTDNTYYLYYGNPNEQATAPAYSAYGLQFNNSSNDYISTPSLGFSTNETGITLSFWLKTTAVNGGSTSIPVAWGTNRYCQIGAVTTHKITCTVDGSTTSGATSSASVDDGNWHFVVFTSSASGANAQALYVDNGSATNSSKTLNTASAAVTLGASSTPGNYFPGALDDVRIYNTVLTSGQVANLFSNTPAVIALNNVWPLVGSPINYSLIGWWKLNDGAATTAIDSSSTGNNGTLNNFSFGTSDGWIVNKNLLAATPEPTSVTPVTTAEQESPIFFTYRTVTNTGSIGSFPTSGFTQVTNGEQQLGSSGVYLKFNEAGKYSRNDIYHIASWAVEPFSSTRGRKRSFPTHANIVADAAGISIIDADTNNLWMRFNLGTNFLLGATNAPVSVAMKNGRLYAGGANGLFDIQFDLDTAQKYASGGNGAFPGNVEGRNTANAYSLSGDALKATTVNGVAVTVATRSSIPQQVVATGGGSGGGATVLYNETGFSANATIGTDGAGTNAYTGNLADVNFYGNGATTDTFSKVALTSTSGGQLYGINITHPGVNRFDNLSNITDSSTPSATYSTASTPALTSNTINALSVGVGSSTSDNVSNTIALANATGTDVIQENSTTANGTVRYYVPTGTIGSSNWSSQQFGGAINFIRGSTTYVTVPDSASLSLTGNFTIDTWIKPSTVNATEGIVEKLDASTHNGYGLLLTSSGTVQAVVANGSGSDTATSTGTLTAGTWYHLAATYDGSNLKVYINGVNDGTQATSRNPTDGTDALIIGGDGITPASNNFNGLIDEVRVSSTNRYTSNFTPSTAPFTSDASTAGLWHFDEVKGTTTYDFTSNANNGTLTNSPLFVAPAIAGSATNNSATALADVTNSTGRDLTFDGSNDYVQINDASSLKFGTGNFSISAWINMPNADTTFDPIYVKLDSAGTGAGIIFETAPSNSTYPIYFYVGDNSVQYSDVGCTGGTNLDRDGKWHHIVVTKSGATTLAVYNDGSVCTNNLGSHAGPTGNTDNTEPAFIGRRRDGTPAFAKASIADVRVYNRALNAGDVTTLYNKESTLADTRGLVAQWKLNAPVAKTISASPAVTVDDSSGNGNYGQLFNGTGNSPAADGVTNGPIFANGTPVKDGRTLLVGTDDGSGANNGAVTGTSLDTDKQSSTFTTSNSGLPGNDITSLATGTNSGAILLVGTKSGAYSTGFGGFIVTDLALTPATIVNPVRVKGGTTVRIKGGGTVRVE